MKYPLAVLQAMFPAMVSAFCIFLSISCFECGMGSLAKLRGANYVVTEFGVNESGQHGYVGCAVFPFISSFECGRGPLTKFR